MKIFFSISLIINSTLLTAQLTDGFRLEQLYEEQFNSFYQSNYLNAISLYDSIQIRTNNISLESIKIALKSCDQLIKSNISITDKEKLTIRKEYLNALLNWRQHNEQTSSQKEEIKPKINNEDSFRENYNTNTFYRWKNKYIQDDQKYKLHDLEAELMRFDDSRLDYRQFKKNNRIGILFITGMIASYSTSLIVANKNRTLSTGSLIFGSISLIAATPFMDKAATHLSKSIWHYNREITLFKLE